MYKRLDEDGITEVGETSRSPIDRLRAISGNPAELRERLMNADPIIPGMLQRGTTSIWFALPNGGKTLFAMRSVVDALREGRLDGRFTFYINEDDNLEGFIEKSELATRYGFNMISSVQSLDSEIRNARDILNLLTEVASMPECKRVFVIIDTLKKFTSVMSKEAAPAFFELMRKVNAGGGTIMILAHANKRNNPDAPLIPAGVQDIMDDVDVMYAIESFSDREEATQRCEFQCRKDRGPVEQSISWEYKKGQLFSYPEMIESIKLTGQEGIQEAKEEQRRLKALQNHRDAASFLEAVLGRSEMMQKDILEASKDPDLNPNGVGQQLIRRAINALDGMMLSVRTDRSQNNAKFIRWKSEAV